jgi:uncharacterized protein YbjT (DUF2867 family)
VLAVFPFIAPGLIIQFPAGKPFNTTLPVATVHVGCVIVPTVGAAGVTGCVLITTLADAGEIHPTELVTVKVRVPAARPGMVRFVPVPAIAPGLTVQFPAGKPPKITLPVATAQVGCVIMPTVGAEGVTGCVLITTFAVAGDVHPTELVTVNEYVPAANPETVLLAPVPAIAPGFIVQVPVGNPVSITLPVATEQVGWVIVLKVGADGVTGCVFITALAEGREIHPEALVTV